jgi:hypothetical protein
MAKITEQDKQTYHDRAKYYRTMASASLKTEKELLASKIKNLSEAPFIKIKLVDEMLNLTSNYIAINGISNAVLKNKNEESLNDGRKSMYKAVIYLEEIVGNYVDAPFSEYEEKLAAIEIIDSAQRYNLIRKMGLTLDLLESAYGDNSKWRWTFVELEGRFAVVAKNIIDLKYATANARPDSPDYEPVVYHFRLVKKLLAHSADRYREKYELSTGAISDFRTGIAFLNALRRLFFVTNDRDEVEDIKKKLAIWTTKLEADIKKQEDAKKRK